MDFHWEERNWGAKYKVSYKGERDRLGIGPWKKTVKFRLRTWGK